MPQITSEGFWNYFKPNLASGTDRKLLVASYFTVVMPIFMFLGATLLSGWEFVIKARALPPGTQTRSTALAFKALKGTSETVRGHALEHLAIQGNFPEERRPTIQIQSTLVHTAKEGVERRDRTEYEGKYKEHSEENITLQNVITKTPVEMPKQAGRQAYVAMKRSEPETKRVIDADHIYEATIKIPLHQQAVPPVLPDGVNKVGDALEISLDRCDVRYVVVQTGVYQLTIKETVQYNQRGSTLSITPRPKHLWFETLSLTLQ